MAIHELTRLFGFFRKPIRIKRAQLLTSDESRNRNLIFVGSSQSNAAVAEVGPLREFNFKPLDSRPGTAKERGVVNEHPRMVNNHTIRLRAALFSDYAIIALRPGPDPSNRCLLLEGTNTYGTRRRQNTPPARLAWQSYSTEWGWDRADVSHFEALLAVTVNDGVPVQSKLVLVRTRK